MKKVTLIENSFLKTKDKKLLELIRINASRENYDADYEATRIQVFVSQFKENKIKQRGNKIKAL